MTRQKSPISWVGGKHHMAPIIVSLFPSHEHYVEVMTGAGHVFFRKAPSRLETINDINGDLMNFWMVCRDHNQELRDRLKWTPYSRMLFEQWKNTALPPDPVERAARWFYLNAAQFSSVFHGGWSYIRTPSDTGSPPPRRFRARIDRLEAVRDRIADVQIECSDYRAILERFGGKEENLLYIDPPYFGYERHYVDIFTEEDHRTLAAMLNSVEAKVILSYGDHPLIRELYKDWAIRWFAVVRPSAKVSEGEEKPKASELILMNYEVEPDLFPTITATGRLGEILIDGIGIAEEEDLDEPSCEHRKHLG